MKTFLICPVRGHEMSELRGVVDDLEAQGYEVHWPYRDTNQADPTGLRICTDNMLAISRAEVIHVVWDGKSEGCLFDLGMAFALHKKIIPISLPPATEGKSFQNMITAWAEHKSESTTERRTRIRGKKRREEVVLAIYELSHKFNSIPCTVREIMDKTGIPSTSNTVYIVNRLCREGLVDKADRISRTIQLTEDGIEMAKRLLSDKPTIVSAKV